MNLFSAIVLGIVQGLTEFLPVSSSGHLVIFQKILPGFDQPGVLFDVVLHFGTLAAVFYYFRKKILKLKFNYLYLLAIGTVPALLVGFLFKDHLEQMFSDPQFLGYEFIITAIICFLIDRPTAIRSNLNVMNAFLIGIAQAVAIIPAISRSGATIFGGVKLGIKKEEAAEYSFLLSIPAILGANLLEIISYSNDLESKYFDEYFAGFLVAFLIGFLTIRFLLKMLVNNKFKYFGFYSLAVGIFVLIFF